MIAQVIDFISKDYVAHLLTLIGIYLLLAHSLNLTFGLGRLFNLAHIATYAIGAYTTALLSVEAGYNFVLCLLASALTAGLFAIILGGIAIRLSQDYFAIGTLAFSMIVGALLVNWKSLTRGVLGIPGIPKPELFGIDFYQNWNFLIFIAIITFFVLLLLKLLFVSQYARKLRAQAEFDAAAQSLGIDTRLVRNISFFISSMICGLAGGLFAYHINYIDPSSFAFHEMAFVLSIVIIGRPGSFIGCCLATTFLVLLPEPLRFIEIESSVLGPARQILYASILFLVVYWKKDQLFPMERRI
jgi:branched-chain amino acid transport system permease protein